MIDQGHIAETNDRTVGPFTAVIAEYRRHQTKVLDRVAKQPVTESVRPGVRAAAFYASAADLLEGMNETI